MFKENLDYALSEINSLQASSSEISEYDHAWLYAQSFESGPHDDYLAKNEAILEQLLRSYKHKSNQAKHTANQYLLDPLMGSINGRLMQAIHQQQLTLDISKSKAKKYDTLLKNLLEIDDEIQRGGRSSKDETKKRRDVIRNQNSPSVVQLVVPNRNELSVTPTNVVDINCLADPRMLIPDLNKSILADTPDKAEQIACDTMKFVNVSVCISVL